MDFKNNKLVDIRKHYVMKLNQVYEPRESEILVFILIEHFFRMSKTDIFRYPPVRLTESEMLKLHMAVKELLRMKPVQYITGETEFLNYKFFVNENVLIPRPETEELVMLVVDNEKEQGLRVIDIGTGSGCIAVSLDLLLDDSEVVAIDIDEKALKVAERNADLNNASIRFLQTDILDNGLWLGSQFDIVVSNPPYVTNSEKNQLRDNVLEYEPHKALFVDDDDPLKYYGAIATFCKVHLRKNGRFYVEINEKLGKEVVSLMSRNFSKVKLWKDLNGKNRFVSGVKTS